MIALVTIGQSPRHDVVASMFNAWTPPRLLEAGALDGLTAAEISALGPGDTDHPLVTRLSDGSEVVIAKAAMLPYLQAAVDRVVETGADVVCVLCTGEFPTLTAAARLVFPDRLLFHTVEALLPSGTLGVLMPHAGQHDMMLKKWTTASRTVVTRSASPYALEGSFGSAAQTLVEAGAELIVMDCMGFDREMLRTVRDSVTVPVLLANGVVGALLGELTGSPELAQVTGRG
jgi:protein AroM